MFGKHGINEKFKKTNDKDNTITKINRAVNATTKNKIKYLAGQLSKLIENGNITLPARFFTPFSKNDGVSVRPNGCRNLKVEAGAMDRYENLAEIINEENPYYDKDQLVAIYDYLNLLTDKEITGIKSFNDKVKKHMYYNLDGLNERLRKALDYFSALLMIAEPYRFQDQGRQSRALIRKMSLDPSVLIENPMTQKNAASNINALLLEPNKYDDSMEDGYEDMSDDEYTDTPKYTTPGKPKTSTIMKKPLPKLRITKQDRRNRWIKKQKDKGLNQPPTKLSVTTRKQFANKKKLSKTDKKTLESKPKKETKEKKTFKKTTKRATKK